MKKMAVFLAMLVIALITLPAGVQAPTRILSSYEEFHETFILTDDDVIKWNWGVTSGGDVDFWIEDLLGTRYNEMDDVVTSNDNFKVPEGGIWEIHIYNDGLDTVTLDYEFSTESGIAEDLFLAFLLPIIIGVVVLVVIIIVIIVLLVTKKKPAQPPQYPPQQPGYPPQQPPGQYPPQQPGYPPQQPPAQPPPQP